MISVINLCELFGVEEGEEFEFNKYKGSRYKVSNGRLEFLTDKCWVNSAFEFNEAIGCEVIKLPKKKEFTDDELCILRNIDKKYKWIARDKSYTTYTHEEKPTKERETWENVGHWCSLYAFKHLFNSIQWKDEEPVFIDDYVERGVE